MSTSFSLSLELVLLMSWLLKHEKKALNELIKKSLKTGLIKEIELFDTFTQEQLLDMDSEMSDEFHNAILDFLMHMEKRLIDGLGPKRQLLENQNLLSISPKINTEKKDVLFYELLKNWNPKQNEPIN